MDYKHYPALARKALGIEKSELVLKNAHIVNVFTEEIIHGDIAVQDGLIVGVGEYEGICEVDLDGKFVAPGFIDAHLHLESTLVAPPQLIYSALAWGTTTFIVDPHEAANVSGQDGIDYILEQTSNVDANVFVMLPSCVPSAKGEDNGYELTAQKMRRYLDNPRVLGLGEVMDSGAVISGDKEMMAKLALFAGRIIDGHAPGLNEKQLAAYTLAGISTDHEGTDFEYIMAERRNGMHILVREGSAARNMQAIVSGIIQNNVDTSGFSFCTDDKHIDDIRREGHISYMVKRSVALGMPVIKALKMASYNTARHYGLKQLGAIAPGYQADFVVLDDLENLAIDSVYHRGRKMDFAKPVKRIPTPEKLLHTMNFMMPDQEKIQLVASGEAVPAIRVIPGQIVTKREDIVLPHANGAFVADKAVNKCIVVERYRDTGKIGIAPVLGFELANGAVATSVAHDSHNIIVIGDNDADMLVALEQIKQLGGGYVIASNGEVVGQLALPVMGLISDEGFEAVQAKLHSMIEKAHQMGVPEDMDPFVTLSFVALTAIPEIRITTNGLWMFDV